MKVLTFTTLYPNESQPRHGIFIGERVRHLNDLEGLSFRVVAPVPWFPFRIKKLSKYSVYSTVPQQEVRSEIRVFHPRYPVLPKIGMSLSPILLAAFTYRYLKSIQRDGYDFDIIDSHYFYPDGVAAVILGKLLNKPVMVTARGSDITLIPNYYIPRKLIQWAANNARQIAAVSQSLKDSLMGLGVDGSRIDVFRNGVDLVKFRPLDRDTIRHEMGLTRFTLLSVGNLIELKGHHLIIEALRHLPDTMLIIVGEGVMRSKLKKTASDCDVNDRVRFLNNVSQPELCKIYNAADVLVLASSREGMANVLLEALACGTPVVATDVGGNSEVIKSNNAGLIISDRNTNAIVSGVNQVKNQYPARQIVREYAETLSWEETSNLIKNRINSMYTNINT